MEICNLRNKNLKFVNGHCSIHPKHAGVLLARQCSVFTYATLQIISTSINTWTPNLNFSPDLCPISKNFAVLKENGMRSRSCFPSEEECVRLPILCRSQEVHVTHSKYLSIAYKGRFRKVHLRDFHFALLLVVIC